MNIEASKAEVIEAGRRLVEETNRQFLEEIKTRIARREQAVREALAE